MLFVMVKEDYCSLLSKVELMLLIFLNIDYFRILFKISDLVFIGRKKSIIYIMGNIRWRIFVVVIFYFDRFFGLIEGNVISYMVFSYLRMKFNKRIDIDVNSFWLLVLG